MEFAYREWLGTHMVVVTLVTTGAVAAAYGFTGPVGTYDALTLPQRLSFSFLIASAGWPICYSLNLVTLYFMRFRRLLPIAFALTIVALFEAIICTAMAHLADTLIRPGYSTGAELLPVYIVTGTTTVSCSLLFLHLVYQRVKTVSEPTNAELSSVSTVPEVAAGDLQEISHRGNDQLPAPLVGLLPRELGNDIIYIKSEDHYVYVYTAAGFSLIRMRFSDAVAGLGESGFQVHRSYWVAHRHIQELVNQDRKLLLRLTGDHQVPVSGPYRGAVRLTMKSRVGC